MCASSNDNASQVILSPEHGHLISSLKLPLLVVPSSTYLILPCSPLACPSRAPHTYANNWDSPEAPSDPHLPNRQYRQPLHPLPPCSAFAALPAPRTALGLVTLKQQALLSPHQPARPPACLCLPSSSSPSKGALGACCSICCPLIWSLSERCCPQLTVSIYHDVPLAQSTLMTVKDASISIF